MNEYPARSRRLPAYRAILAVDAVRSAGHRSAGHPGLAEAIPAVLEQTLMACGLPEIWARRHFAQATGGGYIFGASPEYLPFLIDPLFDGLQLALEDTNLDLAARRRDLRIRLRVSVHIGPVPSSEDGGPDSAGEPVSYAFRLLDSVPIRDVLRNANPDVTLAAAIVSQRVYKDVILAGYTGLHPDRFDAVTASVPGKDFAEPAWLYVPIPSRAAMGRRGSGSLASRRSA